MREIKIAAAQARLIEEADKAAKTAQGQLLLVLKTVLAGHGVGDAEVLKMDTDRDPPVLIIRDQARQNGAPELRKLADSDAAELGLEVGRVENAPETAQAE